jgi:hypothetical protein
MPGHRFSFMRPPTLWSRMQQRVQIALFAKARNPSRSISA